MLWRSTPNPDDQKNLNIRVKNVQTRQAFIVRISHDHDFSPVTYSTSTHRDPFQHLDRMHKQENLPAVKCYLINRQLLIHSGIQSNISSRELNMKQMKKHYFHWRKGKVFWNQAQHQTVHCKFAQNTLTRRWCFHQVTTAVVTAVLPCTWQVY